MNWYMQLSEIQRNAVYQAAQVIAAQRATTAGGYQTITFTRAPGQWFENSDTMRDYLCRAYLELKELL